MQFKKIGYFLLASVAFLYLSNKEEIERWSLRSQMTEATVILVSPGKGGGTGFAVKTENGSLFTLTNDHICDLADENGTLFANEQEQLVPLKVLHRSPYTDLCLVSPLLYKTPLKLGSKYYIGEKVFITGHGRLYDDTMTDGEVVQAKRVMVGVREVDSKEECEIAPKYKYVEINFIFTTVGICAIEVDAVITTAQILPGNSGSPVVNRSGELIGVAFASGSNDINRAWVIPLKSIQEFLKHY